MTYYTLGGKNAEGQEETPHVTGKVYFLIYCAVCKTGLCKNMVIAKSPKKKQNMIFVEPCPNCLEAARQNLQVVAVSNKGLEKEYGNDSPIRG